MGQQIHWFPGHMNKALNEVENKVKLVDVIIELLTHALLSLQLTKI